VAIRRAPSLVEQVKTHLKQRIINAEFESDRIPSETELASQLQVSRNTIRDALSRLEMEGIINRRQGAGTFINSPDLLVKTRLEEIVPYKTLIAEHGHVPSVEVILAEETTTNFEVSQTLGLEPTSRLLEVQKLFRAGQVPVIFAHFFIPLSTIVQPYTSADFQQPIFEFLADFCQNSLSFYLTDVVPCVASPWLAERLQLQKMPTALVSFQEVGYNQNSEPIVKATSYFRHDLLRLRLVRRQI
jgi:GntR family transcriptional regulator